MRSLARHLPALALTALLGAACQADSRVAAPPGVARKVVPPAPDPAFDSPGPPPGAAASTPVRSAALLPPQAGAQSREPRLGQDELRARFTPFPNALTPIVPIGEKMVALQTPMSIAYFDTRASATEVLTFYVKEFERRGWSWTGLKNAREVIDHPAVSATDPEDHTQMSVIVMGHSRSEPNTVILAIADTRPQARVPDEGDLPTYPGAAPLALRAIEAGASTFNVSFLTHDSPVEVETFYRKRMVELGWAEKRSQEEDAVDLTYAKLDRVWHIRVRLQQKDQTLVVAQSGAPEELP